MVREVDINVVVCADMRILRRPTRCVAGGKRNMKVTCGLERDGWAWKGEDTLKMTVLC
jgi:hypothetical protein